MVVNPGNSFLPVSQNEAGTNSKLVLGMCGSFQFKVVVYWRLYW